jgi:hypothetical protein
MALHPLHKTQSYDIRLSVKPGRTEHMHADCAAERTPKMLLNSSSLAFHGNDDLNMIHVQATTLSVL